MNLLVSKSSVTVHFVTFFLFVSGVFAWWRCRDPCPWPTTSGSITDRSGPMMWRLATRDSHVTVGEALFLSSTTTSCSVDVFDNVGRSTGFRWGIYAFDATRVKWMWAGERIEPNCYNVVSHRTYCNALFIVLCFRCFRLAKKQTSLSTIDDFWQHHCPTSPIECNIVKKLLWNQ